MYPRHPVGQAEDPTQPREGFKLPSASVPVVLLTLGGLCLLVAAIVFVAVTWSLLGLTGRTLVLLGFTGVLAAVAVLLTRAGLRGAAETFWLVVAGMLTVDLLAAESAGLAGLDALSVRGTAALVGGALLAMGIGVGAWARGQRLGQLYGVQVVAVIGGLVLCSANAWAAENPAVGTTIAIPLLAGAFVLLRRLVPWTAYGLGGLAGFSWLVLVGLGWDRALEPVGLGDWWADFRGWPLLVAALFAAVVVHLPGVRDEARAIAAGSALVPLVLLANGPATIGTSTRDLLTACATLVVLALVTAFAPRAWAQGAAALTGLGVLLAGILLVAGPWPALLSLSSGESTAVDPAMATLSDTASWMAVVVALTMVAAAASLLRHVPVPARRDATQLVGTLAPAVVALGGLVLVLELEPPLWAAVLAAGLATAIAAGAAWWSRDAILAAVAGSCATAYLALVDAVRRIVRQPADGPRHHRTVPGPGHGRGTPGAGHEDPGLRRSGDCAGRARRRLGAGRLGSGDGVRHRGTRPGAGGVRRPGRHPGRSPDSSYLHPGRTRVLGGPAGPRGHGLLRRTSRSPR